MVKMFLILKNFPGSETPGLKALSVSSAGYRELAQKQKEADF